MVWPFSSSSSNSNKNTVTDNDASQSSQIFEKIDPSLKTFFNSEDPNPNPSPISSNSSDPSNKNTKFKPEPVNDPEIIRQKSQLTGKYYGPQVSISAAARENCAELQLLLSNCLYNTGDDNSKKQSFWKLKTTSCFSKSINFSNCIVNQKKAMRTMGYDNVDTPREKELIKWKSDDLYLNLFGENGDADGHYEENLKVLNEQAAFERRRFLGEEADTIKVEN